MAKTSSATDGGNGKDLIIGDRPGPYASTSVSFHTASTWAGAISPDGSKVTLPGLTISSVGGFIAPWNNGMGVMSPSDVGFADWRPEVDAYNDTREGLNLKFDVAQTTVSVTLKQLYIEQIVIFQPEKANFTLTFTDGTTKTGVAAAVTQLFPGEITLTFDPSTTGGKLIAGISLKPSLELPTVPPGTPPQYGENYNATHPFSEFTLKAVTYTKDASGPARNDVLTGGNGKDTVYGGNGNDTISGNNGADVLVGGSGNNKLTGGNGPDTFVFSYESQGADVITDFANNDSIRLDQGVTVASVSHPGGSSTLHLTSGGTVTLTGVFVSDWHDLL